MPRSGPAVLYTTTDLEAIRSALLRNERTVQFADRSVTYRSVEELKAIERDILRELADGSPLRRPKRVCGVATKGL